MSKGLCCACTGTGWGSVPPGDLGADRPVPHPAENRIGQAATSLPKENHGGAQWQSQRPARDPVLGVGSPALGSPWPLALPLERPSLFLATPEHGAGQALLAGGTVAQPPPCQGRLGPRSLVSLAAQLSEPRGPQGPRFQNPCACGTHSSDVLRSTLPASPDSAKLRREPSAVSGVPPDPAALSLSLSKLVLTCLGAPAPQPTNPGGFRSLSLPRGVLPNTVCDQHTAASISQPLPPDLPVIFGCRLSRESPQLKSARCVTAAHTARHAAAPGHGPSQPRAVLGPGSHVPARPHTSAGAACAPATSDPTRRTSSTAKVYFSAMHVPVRPGGAVRFPSRVPQGAVFRTRWRQAGQGSQQQSVVPGSHATSAHSAHTCPMHGGGGFSKGQ